MGSEQQQTVSALDNSVTQSVTFSLYDPQSNIVLEISATYTYPVWNFRQKLSMTSGILDQNISSHGIRAHTV